MRIADVMKPDGKVFLKSEWGPFGDEWPCLSFTKKSVGDRLRAEFRPERDVLVFVGTTNGEFTENPDHRSRLLSAVVVEPNQVLESRKIVPPEVWKKSCERWGDRGPHAMAVTRGYGILGKPLPDAREVVPQAYTSFADFENRGSFVEAIDEERAAVMKLDVEEIEIHLSEDVRRYIKMADALSPDVDKGIKQEANRIARSIQQRVEASGSSTTRNNPLRFAPNLSDLITLITNTWVSQRGNCTLCGGRIPTHSVNRLLQASVDRIDSANPYYAEGNVQVTHLACNWAKNNATGAQFLEWLDVVRGENETPSQAAAD